MSLVVRHQMRSAFVRNLMRLPRPFAHSPIATEGFNMIAMQVPFLRRSFVPSFHSSPFHCSSCGPCACSKCMQDRRQPICEICKVNPTVHQSHIDFHDRKGLRLYNFTSYCEQCWENQRAEREQRRKEEEILDRKKARVASMLDNVQQIRSTEDIPINFAVDKFMAEVNPENIYIRRALVTPKMRREVQKMYLTERISYANAFMRYHSEVIKVRSAQNVVRFRGKFQRQIIDGYPKSFRL